MRESKMGEERMKMKEGRKEDEVKMKEAGSWREEEEKIRSFAGGIDVVAESASVSK